MRKQFTFQSHDQITKCKGYLWEPKKNPVGIVQLVHGMQEYILRYDELAQFLTEQGYIVVGHDHLGHGDSILEEKYLGYFAKEHGDRILIQDVHTVYKITRRNHKALPYFLLGHSMGSFIVRNYMTCYPNSVNGILIMGTGNHPAAVSEFGILVCKILKKKKGEFSYSHFLDDQISGRFRRAIRNAQTPQDWISRNKENVDAYRKDSKCMFRFTISAYEDLLRLTRRASKRSVMLQMNTKTPVLFLSGKEDPVGGCGRGVQKGISIL